MRGSFFIPYGWFLCMVLSHALLPDLSSYHGSDLTVFSPIDRVMLATLKADTPEMLARKIEAAHAAFHAWRLVPAPKRGELVRRFGEDLRTHKEALAGLVTLECGKILEEGRGEIQEMIDICDFAVGLSRTIGGLTIPSERSEHSMQEQWYPLGVVGIISAFNFPAAVWAWNAALALVCGNSIVWKPSEKTPLTAIACFELLNHTIARSSDLCVPAHLSELTLGSVAIGEALVRHVHVALVSATGSTRMGKAVAPLIAARCGRALLELGGNNAVVVTESADLAVALPSILFGAVGTAGQRCTTTRRALIHRARFEEVTQALKTAYATLASKIGDPRMPGVLIGPLIDVNSYKAMEQALQIARLEGGVVQGGERVLLEQFPQAVYVNPALVVMKKQTPVVMQETFAPILYAIPYDTLEEALQLNNAVAQGLSAAIFTTDVREAEYFKLHCDCGIANVNIGTSGAEIGGAFGGEKETGGGRESGSDAWKTYMRRQTSTTYYGRSAPQLAQGIRFE